MRKLTRIAQFHPASHRRVVVDAPETSRGIGFARRHPSNRAHRLAGNADDDATTRTHRRPLARMQTKLTHLIRRVKFPSPQ
eukprot:CAMPEP_0174584250 /NCGR_PEP_ID=MMETSP0929-20130131/16758_1 /TAXON_ID=548131 ORGANISM="Ostreococcus mediterraneus, Strain clade-D-RCC2572" /NCGR_SAMPLE_ID=MMETSP0929 /ASSEMBLY_ACC=CAM_ASM_000573 /LENGTH=80 /DNA_ID=CAMNT_0015766149 /DNA_START=255 /DNA_END=494 /DNA_ORIENTATION=-